MKKSLAIICSAAMLLCSCASQQTASGPLEFSTDSDNSWISGSEPISSSIYVDKIDGLSQSFIRAVDISSVISEKKRCCLQGL